MISELLRFHLVEFFAPPHHPCLAVLNLYPQWRQLHDLAGAGRRTVARVRQEARGVQGDACRHEGAVELHALQRPVERRQPVAREARHAPMDGEPILAAAPLGSAVAHAAQPDAAHVLPS